MKDSMVLELADAWELQAEMDKTRCNEAGRAALRACADTLRMMVDSQPDQREAEMEELLRSARCIAARRGADTAWERFDASVQALGIGSVTARVYKVLPSDDA